MIAPLSGGGPRPTVVAEKALAADGSNKAVINLRGRWSAGPRGNQAIAAGAGGLARRFSLASLLAVAFAAFALASAPTAAAQEIADASCPGPPTDSLTQNPETVWAQTFTALNTGELTRAQASVLKDAGTTGDYVLSIHTVDGSGVPTDTVLATTTIDDAPLPEETLTTIEGVFATPADVVAGEQYALAVSRPGGGPWQVGTRAGDLCPGTLYHKANSSSPFAPEALSVDMVFAVFVTLSPDTPPVTPVTPPVSSPVTPVVVTCRGQPATIVGTSGNDGIVGTPGRDVIAALEGNDKVSGLAGEDLVCGDSGNDTLKGGKGKDELLGQGGKDKLRGGGAKDVCKGGKGDDSAAKCELEKSI